MKLQKNDICQLIPHTKNMCLIDRVSQWDNKAIFCQSDSHKDLSNPLRNRKCLPISALIEYGAQAMAIHGALLAKQEGIELQQGYIASLRDVELTQHDDLAQFQSSLTIHAEQLMASGGNMIYNFKVTAENIALIRGRATVVAIFKESLVS